MNIALASLNNAYYQPLANITAWQNKIFYCDVHGYIPYFKNNNFKNSISSDFQPNTHSLGFEKIQTILEVFSKHPTIDLVWFNDCDSLITNFKISILDIINDYKYSDRSEILLSEDGNGINVGSMLVYNTSRTRDYLNFIVEQQSNYRDKSWNEQQVIIDTYKDTRWVDLVEIIPQKAINSYDYNLYQASQIIMPIEKAKLTGQWSSGDLLIHWPAKSLEERLELAKKYLTQVVK